MQEEKKFGFKINNSKLILQVPAIPAMKKFNIIWSFKPIIIAQFGIDFIYLPFHITIHYLCNAQTTKSLFEQKQCVLRKMANAKRSFREMSLLHVFSPSFHAKRTSTLRLKETFLHLYARWRFKQRDHFGHFNIPRHRFYEYCFSRSEIKRVCRLLWVRSKGNYAHLVFLNFLKVKNRLLLCTEK